MAKDASTPACASAPPSNPPPSFDTTAGDSLPGGFLASAEGGAYNSGNEYNYGGKWSGAMYLGTTSTKGNNSDPYLDLHSSCCYISTDSSPLEETSGSPVTDTPHQDHSSSRTLRHLQGVNTIYLARTILALLCNPLAHCQSHYTCSS